MQSIRMGMVEAQFADIIWENAPISTKDLVKRCQEELNWKRTTTYTVLKKLCERGVFKTENSVVSVLISKEAFMAIQSEQFVHENFNDSLPAFVVAFMSRKKPSQKELSQIRKLLDSFEG